MREFSRIQQLREDADYGAGSNIGREKTIEIVETAEKFLSKAKKLV